MSSAKITLFGLNNENSSLFDGFSNLPSGIDTDQLEKNILLRGGEFEVLYPDPDFCQEAIESWAVKWTPTIRKWVDALAIKYDPLYNYDRRETYVDTSTGTSSGTTDSTGSNVTTGQSSSSSGDTGTDTTENTVSAYDSNTYQPHDKDTVTYGKTTSGSTTTSGTVSNIDSISTSGEDKRTSTHTARLYGNIGVTTTQEMLRSELEIARFNLIDQITDLFLTEFVIPVYY